MKFDPIELTQDLMHAEGINFHVFKQPYDNIGRFDMRLRSQLYVDYDYEDIRQRLRDDCQEKTLYITTDQFETHYLIFRDSRPVADDGDIILIGPFLTSYYESILHRVIERNNLPAIQHTELKNHYCGIPFFEDTGVIESQVIILARYIMDGTDFVVDRTSLNFKDSAAGFENQPEPSTRLSMSMVEERYKIEDEFLEAIEHGDAQSALLYSSTFRKFQLEPRNTDIVRNYKNFFYVLNTLLRKAVQRADVHPAHIDETSAYFFRMIEASRSLETLRTISPEMIRRYCRLVLNHSLRKYSKTIQRVINHVDFHLTDPLSLKVLAGIAKVNASYLSTQFKKETGQNLTDHINQKRIQKAVFFLNTTEMPIHAIAERVGILDENYFSRLFKRIQGMPPSEYRKSLRS